MARGLGRSMALALLVPGALYPLILRAQPAPVAEFAVPAATIPISASSSVFDIAGLGEAETAASRLRDAELIATDQNKLSGDDKIKLNWSYRPLDEGPQFEVGAFGSHRDGTKKPIVHVGMDWSF